MKRANQPRIGTAAAAFAVIAWVLVSDDWDEVIDNGRAGNALSVTVGITIVAFLLAMLVLLIKATSPRR